MSLTFSRIIPENYRTFPGKLPECYRNVTGHFPVRWRHTIRNGTFRCESLGISYCLIKFPDSRHVQLAIYAVFHEESESAVRIEKFLHLGEEIKKNQPTRVSISYRKISYCMSPPYIPDHRPGVSRRSLENSFHSHSFREDSFRQHSFRKPGWHNGP